jgi:sodium-dependent phosphate cotransporter
VECGLRRARVVFRIFAVVFFLYLFFVSIELLGVSFRLSGKSFVEELIATTSDPLIGFMIGILATSLVQSSSVTTSIVVGLVAGGALSIRGAIPIIMGANVGTTITNILVSLGHLSRREEFRRAFAGATAHDFFNLLTAAVLLPIEYHTRYLERLSSATSALFLGGRGFTFTSPLKLIVSPVTDFFVHLASGAPLLLVIPAFIFLFISLRYIVVFMRKLVLLRLEEFFHRYLFGNIILSMLLGVIITAIIQSSSVTTSLVVPMVGAGILTVEAIFPYTLGANVGTTVTALLASLVTGESTAVSVALAHLFFNISGILLFLPISRIRRIPIALAKKLGEKAAVSRKYAIIFVIGVFYIIPFTLILLRRLFLG